MGVAAPPLSGSEPSLTEEMEPTKLVGPAAPMPTMSAMPTIPVGRTELPARVSSPSKRYQPYQDRPASRQPVEGGGRVEKPTMPTMSAEGDRGTGPEVDIRPIPTASGSSMEVLPGKPRRVDHLDHEDRKRVPATREERRNQAGEGRKKWKATVIEHVRKATGEKKEKPVVKTIGGQKTTGRWPSPRTSADAQYRRRNMYPIRGPCTRSWFQA